MNTDFPLPYSFVRATNPETQERLRPRRGSPLAAGWDLVADLEKPLLIQPMERVIVPTGLAVAVPAGWEAQVRPRSGLALHHGLTVLNSPGTIDADYRGEIKVLLIHLGSEPFELSDGTRMAQLVLSPTHTGPAEWTEVLPDTQRGDGGFGSTGTR